MPARNGRVPNYRLHKPSGQARVIVNGRHVYLGKYGSTESREKYARLLVGLLNGESVDGSPAASMPADTLSVKELLLLYSQFAESYYVCDGKPTKELAAMSDALWPVRQLFGSTRASEFGPKGLKTVRQHLVEQGLSRE